MAQRKKATLSSYQSLKSELQTAYLIALWAGLGFVVFFCFYLQPALGDILTNLIIVCSIFLAILATIIVFITGKSHTKKTSKVLTKATKV